MLEVPYSESMWKSIFLMASTTFDQNQKSPLTICRNETMNPQNANIEPWGTNWKGYFLKSLAHCESHNPSRLKDKNEVVGPY